MRIGVPREIKVHEYRAGLTPAGVRELVARGHEVLVQRGLGTAIDLTDAQYQAAGATLMPDAVQVFASAELIVKVKEPQHQEVALLREGQVLFTYLHLAPDPHLTEGLVRSGAVAVAYETVTGPGGRLPLLAPMSEVAGRMSVQVGATYLESPRAGRGVLLGGVPGVPAARVVVIGAGVVGGNAVQMAVGTGAHVTVLDLDVERLRQFDARWGNRVETMAANAHHIEEAVLAADLVIGAVLVPGAAAPRLLDRATVARMKRGSVLVDVSIDQGGCFETSRPTTHADPVYMDEGVIHYCVTNMPGAVARTSTFALTNATLPFVLALADKGWQQAMRDDAHLRDGLNVCRGEVACRPVAEALGYAWCDPAAACA